MILENKNRISVRGDIPPMVADMDAKNLKLVPLDPAVPTNPEHVRNFCRPWSEMMAGHLRAEGDATR